MDSSKFVFRDCWHLELPVSVHRRDQGIPNMDSNLLENLIALRDNAVQELTEAHDWANQLKAIINEPFSTDRSVEANYLIAKILRSFTVTISMLNSGKVTDPVPAKPAGVPMNSASREYRVSGERMKSSPPLPRGHWPKDKRSALGTEIGRRDKREPTPLRKSGIQKNPDRRFFGCANYKLSCMHCPNLFFYCSLELKS